MIRNYQKTKLCRRYIVKLLMFKELQKTCKKMQKGSEKFRTLLNFGNQKFRTFLISHMLLSEIENVQNFL